MNPAESANRTLAFKQFTATPTKILVFVKLLGWLHKSTTSEPGENISMQTVRLATVTFGLFSQPHR